MKRIPARGLYYFLLILFLLIGTPKVKPAIAACNWSYSTAGVTIAASCTVDANTTENYDYSSGTDDATNGYVVTLPASPAYIITVNSGTTTTTTLGVGSFKINGGSIAVGTSGKVQVTINNKCYVPDCDKDGYSPTTTCSTSAGTCPSGTAGSYVRKNKLTALTLDCYDNNAHSSPADTTYYTQQRGSDTTAGGYSGGAVDAAGQSGASYDYNCNGTEDKNNTNIYSCAACTNGSGYGSFQPDINGVLGTNGQTGWLTSAPACGASATLYTVSNGICADPAVADCSTLTTNAASTQSCR